MRWEQVLPGGDGLTAFEASMVPARWRDHSGVRGPVPTMFRAHDWQTCRVLRDLGEAWWRRFGADWPRRAPTGCGPFARGTFRVRL